MTLHEIPTYLRRHGSAILIIAGLALLLYVSIEYTEMFWSQRKLQREWAAQQQPSGTASAHPAALKATLKDDGLVRLSIPKIELAAVVVEGTNRHDLMLGPGHMIETPAPGQLGNSVITAHRDTFFRHIYELQKGDEILVQRNGRTFRYEVLSKNVVQPSDLSVVKQSQDARLTLITCYPTYFIGPAPERLVITSKLVENNSSAVPQPSNFPVERTAQRTIVH